MYEAWVRTPVDNTRLSLFQNQGRDVETYSPKVKNARLDITGANAAAMSKTPWNMTLAKKLAESTAQIAARCPDKVKFRNANWEKEYHDRLYSICLDIVRSRKQPNETDEDVYVRVYNQHKTDSDRKGRRSRRKAVSRSVRRFYLILLMLNHRRDMNSAPGLPL